MRYDVTVSLEGAMRTYTSEEASLLTGAKPAQIEHLVRTGAVRPAQEALRRGMSRHYSLNNLAEIAIAVQLVEVGMPVRAAGLLMERVRGAWHVLADAHQRARASVLLLTRGTDSVEFGGWHSSEFATPEAVADWLRAGNSGVCLNVLAILSRLEQATSDTFEDPIAAFRARLKDAERTARLRRVKGSEK
jgi:hypothetical protein